MKVLFAINSKLAGEDVDVPLTKQRPVKSVMLIVCTGDRVCAGVSTTSSSARRSNATAEPRLVLKPSSSPSVRRVVSTSTVARNNTTCEAFRHGPSSVHARRAKPPSDEIFAEFTSEEVDKVEMIYSRFVSLSPRSRPCKRSCRSPRKAKCNAEGVCVDAADYEIFKLTSEDGQFSVKREANDTEVSEFEGVMQFEQDPNQILDALMPLYMNSQILRALQESLALSSGAYERDVHRL